MDKYDYLDHFFPILIDKDDIHKIDQTVLSLRDFLDKTNIYNFIHHLIDQIHDNLKWEKKHIEALLKLGQYIFKYRYSDHSFSL